MKDTVALITAIGTIATPLLIITLGALGWTFRNRIERNQNEQNYWRQYWHELEEKLRDDRVKIYNDILEPYIILFTPDEGFAKEERFHKTSKADAAKGIILSLAYRQTAFKMALVGSDEVVRSFNDLMQYFFSLQPGKNSTESTKEMIGLLGKFLLEIRKSLGNETTALDNLEMLEWFIKDIKQYRNKVE